MIGQAYTIVKVIHRDTVLFEHLPNCPGCIIIRTRRDMVDVLAGICKSSLSKFTLGLFRKILPTTARYGCPSFASHAQNSRPACGNGCCQGNQISSQHR